MLGRRRSVAHSASTRRPAPHYDLRAFELPPTAGIFNIPPRTNSDLNISTRLPLASIDAKQQTTCIVLSLSLDLKLKRRLRISSLTWLRPLQQQTIGHCIGTSLSSLQVLSTPRCAFVRPFQTCWLHAPTSPTSCQRLPPWGPGAASPQQCLHPVVRC